MSIWDRIFPLWFVCCHSKTESEHWKLSPFYTQRTSNERVWDRSRQKNQPTLNPWILFKRSEGWLQQFLKSWLKPTSPELSNLLDHNKFTVGMVSIFSFISNSFSLLSNSWEVFEEYQLQLVSLLLSSAFSVPISSSTAFSDQRIYLSFSFLSVLLCGPLEHQNQQDDFCCLFSPINYPKVWSSGWYWVIRFSWSLYFLRVFFFHQRCWWSLTAVWVKTNLSSSLQPFSVFEPISTFAVDRTVSIRPPIFNSSSTFPSL